jgi:hypothetical protein
VHSDSGILDVLKYNLDFKPAKNPTNGIDFLKQKHYAPYTFRKPDNLLKQVDLYGLEFRNIFNQTPLIAATWMGNIDIIKILCEMGADKNAVDSNGLTAYHIALGQAAKDANYAKKKLPEIYDLLVPDSISFKLDDKLVKLDNHRLVFFMVNLMIAIFHKTKPTTLSKEIWDSNLIRRTEFFRQIKGFATQDFLDAIEHIPVNILPEHRRKRSYLSSILSTNEMQKGGYRLFQRIRTGFYLFNPAVMIKENDEWHYIYNKLDASLFSQMFVEKKDAMDSPEIQEMLTKILESRK